MNPLRKAYYVARYLGPGFVATRLRLLVNQKLQLTRQLFVSQSWKSIDSERQFSGATNEEYAQFKRRQEIPFFFPMGQPPAISDWTAESVALRTPSLTERVDLQRERRPTYFLERPAPTPVHWYRNPFDGRKGRTGVPWCDIPDFTPDQGDPRTLWEPSRAAWAIDLARAAARRTNGESITANGSDFAEMFWQLVEFWMDACPPWRGFQWKCGQEASVRFIALSFGFWTFADDPATTPARWKQFARLAWATGYRVFHHIDYALSQRNNHALSEACGLMLIAHLFPEFKESQRWGEKGREIFERQLPRQIYDDGSYIQHSMNYHRVMLHVSLVAFRLAEFSGRPFARSLYERLGKAGEFLFAMMDHETGQVPRYGNNDGACVLPLNECKFWDFRPVIAATHFLVNRNRLFFPGPWEEDCRWLFGSECETNGMSESSVAQEPLTNNQSSTLSIQESRRFDAGGYYTLRRRNSWAMIRCHTYHDRPGQVDPLHVDLWWKGVNVLRDCGTFQYYVPDRPELEGYFASLSAHNTVEIDRSTPNERVTRFLWFPWPRARVLQFQPDVEIPFFRGERYDYDRRPWNVVHRRTVVASPNDAWLIIDDLHGRGLHSGIVRWHFADVPFSVDVANKSLELQTRQGIASLAVQTHPSEVIRFQIIRGCEERGRVQGIAADQYGDRSPIPTLEVEVAGILPIRVITMIALGTRLMPDWASTSLQAIMTV